MKNNVFKEDKIIYFFGVISTFLLLFQIQILGVSLIKFVVLLFIIYVAYVNHFRIKKVSLQKPYTSFFIAYIVCAIVILLGRSQYKSITVSMLVDFVFTVILCIGLVGLNNMKLLSFIDGVKVSCKIQIIWCGLQTIFWYAAHLDLNRLIFCDGLNLLSVASRYTGSGELCISGISHHPSNMIVVILLIIFLFSSYWKWPLSFGLAILSRNSTTILAVLIAIAMYVCITNWDYIKRARHRIKRSTLIVIAFIIVCIFSSVFFVPTSIFDSINTIFIRISSVFNMSDFSLLEGSTAAHASYYLFFPKIWSEYNVLEKLFGFSLGWTGGMFDLKFGSMYPLVFNRDTINWGVESDLMNFIYGTGIIGTFFFYKWLIQASAAGSKINKKYIILFISLIIAGLFYCIQYNFVIITEVVITEIILRKIDIFNSNVKAIKFKYCKTVEHMPYQNI